MERTLILMLSASLLSVAACEYNPPAGAGPSVGHTSAYDPEVNAQPGDKRPSAPPVGDISPAEIDGSSNSGIIIPVAGGGGRR